MAADLSSANSVQRFSRSASLKTRCSLRGDDQPIGDALSCRRVLSENNLVHPLTSNLRIPRWHPSRIMRSRRNGLLLSADGQVGEQAKSARDSILGRGHSFRLVEGEDKRGATPVSSEFVDRGGDESPSMPGGMADKDSLQIGQNGVALIDNERGFTPDYLSESEYMNEGVGMGDGGDRIDRSGGQGGRSGDSNSADVHYQKMLEANPENPLLLSNYAKFLHEVQQDMAKAEEYYERAVLASPGDGEILSLYAKFIFEIQNDPSRAKAYYERAVKAAPEDCYVLASYAHFLWNSEEDEENDPVLQQSTINPAEA